MQPKPHAAADRMRRATPMLVALLVLFSLTSLRAAPANDSITWMEVTMPPYFVQADPNAANTGYGNLLTAILKERLPEYTHYTMVTNVIRHFDRFKQGEKVCSIGLYKTPERQEFMYFSIPSLLTMPAVLIVRKEKLAGFTHEGHIRLEDVLGDENIIIGLSKDRSYGNSVDAVLKKYSNRKNLVIFSGQELSENFFKMLMLDRLDGLIGLPDEAMYQAEKLGLRDQIATLLIDENQQGYEGWFCFVGCSKNEWGRNVIEKINRILLTERPTERYRKAYEQWLDENSRERYRTIYQQVFLNTTQ